VIQGIIYGSPPHFKQQNATVTFHDARKKSTGKQWYFVAKIVLTYCEKELF
jgi:hypothetical protein